MTEKAQMSACDAAGGHPLGRWGGCRAAAFLPVTPVCESRAEVQPTGVGRDLRITDHHRGETGTPGWRASRRPGPGRGSWCGPATPSRAHRAPQRTGRTARPPAGHRPTTASESSYRDRQRPWSSAVRATQLGGYLAPPRGHHAIPNRSGSPSRSGTRPGPRLGCQLHTDPADRLGSRATGQLPIQRRNRPAGQANRERLPAH
jgi:hypothetical protein